MIHVDKSLLPVIDAHPDFGLYLTGGFVRDLFLGVESKDIDIACESSNFEVMLDWIERTHSKIFLCKPEFLTIRALHHDGDVRDYVMCRKDGAYTDGRHPDAVFAGTIFDDLARRDFTIGAIAIRLMDGAVIDPHLGMDDLRERILRAVGIAEARFTEDPLRILRAIRFSITKDLTLDSEISIALKDPKWASELSTISLDRIREEMHKCFKFDTLKTIRFLQTKCSDELLSALFSEKVMWLKPTLEK